MEKRIKVGVGVVVHDERGNIVMGVRSGSHGAGTHQLPGGHLEHGEGFAACAAREVMEETGLQIKDVKVLAATSDVFDSGEHYVTVFVRATRQHDVEPALEPDKCAKWEWVPWRRMWEWSLEQAKAEKEGREVQRSMFRPLVNLALEFPELEGGFAGLGGGGELKKE
ncbi:hypothetical protein EJ04DRAFT_440020 [Polyplosphaeria fusca]|uniref:Nudix hydrolase domain-containing protein n=1 Tax=Polyplosphaeria fusca TaxID=682080 RepID=A0A9P4V1C9_9PLEO|nr:hypothetical protein EJ04DRAFT_440020 [Polyplosphaeria fusca]